MGSSNIFAVYLTWHLSVYCIISNCKKIITHRTWCRETVHEVHAQEMPGTFSPPPQVGDSDMHHGKCVTHVSLYTPGPLIIGFLSSRGGENVPGISGACATRNFTYLIKGPWLAFDYILNYTTATRQWPNAEFRQMAITSTAINSSRNCSLYKNYLNLSPISYQLRCTGTTVDTMSDKPTEFCR